MALDVGSVVAGYRIEAVLGRGGMGTVYRAAHPTLPRSDALKVLSSDLSLDKHFRDRFLREADLAATLDHPHIVSVYNRGETPDGHLWIAMQYVAGSDAYRELKAGRMTPVRALRITAAVADALDYAHQRGLLHRDVKPANFLLAANDQRIFLADFGIAKRSDDAAGLTQTGMVMASIAYAAPETLTGEPADHRADIYALGCSLYTMLTGQTPFARPGADVGATIAGHLSSPPPKVTERIPHAPTAIDAVIAKAMAKDPNHRFQTASDLAAAAAAALDDTTVQLRTTPTAPRLPTEWTPSVPTGGQPSGPPPAYLGPPGPLHAADAITYPSGWGAAQHQSPTQAAQPGPAGVGGLNRRRRRTLIAAGIAVVVVAVVAGAVMLWNRGPDEPAYQAQTFTHEYGATELTARPQRVAAIGPGDGDAVLSLGVQPVVIGSSSSALPSWEQSAVTGDPTVLSGFTNTAAVADARPDVIIATGPIDQATYDKLAAIAPTLTRPSDQAAEQWTWQNRLTWIGEILGYEAKAKDLISEVRSQQDDLKNQNASWVGKSVEALINADTGVSEILTPSTAANYLEALGLRYSQDLARAATDTGDIRPMPDASAVYRIETDVLVVVRTDSNAGGGGFDGLPRPFIGYQGTMVIVDDADTIAALTGPGGYLASRYLDANFAPKLAREVR
ncbi:MULTISPECIES: serine/threonine-protein kinase [unclassified Mycobacterium]|uniref:serine/threonine-protein kinase n=1 Tax=unclassified Mycobacterium TaxID=2642494 RepID=UPI0007401728|nr:MULTISPECIES: serine/threonine-protein kinase [unclassified Mycobacterium]KUH85693.1 serine/threonine protein kinase [Mycobacterium sp. GA-1999]KUH91550.1 serine/threonine protein kinase [Mycobacterium sp. GA-0227b]